MTVFITVGAPASGKTTWARTFAKEMGNTVIVSRDDIRAAHGFSYSEKKEAIARNEEFVTKVQYAQLEAAFLEGMHVVAADTNLNGKFRRKLIKFCHEHAQDVEVVTFDIPLDDLIVRDSLRVDSVGADVVTRFYNQFRAENPQDESLPAPTAAPYSHGRAANYRDAAVVVDIDGTVARHVSRSPYDESKVLEDEPIDDVIEIIGALAIAGYRIVFVSGRTDKCREDTLKWIFLHFGMIEGEDFELHMRKSKDQRPDYMVKADIYDEHVIPNYNIKMVFDDRDQVVRHVRRRGITVAQVSPGRF